VLVNKYADHLPLYRCAPQALLRQGIVIDRSTLAFWVGYACAELKPLWQLMREELLSSSKLFVDETKAPVLDPGSCPPEPPPAASGILVQSLRAATESGSDLGYRKNHTGLFFMRY